MHTFSLIPVPVPHILHYETTVQDHHILQCTCLSYLLLHTALQAHTPIARYIPDFSVLPVPESVLLPKNLFLCKSRILKYICYYHEEPDSHILYNILPHHRNPVSVHMLLSDDIKSVCWTVNVCMHGTKYSCCLLPVPRSHRSRSPDKAYAHSLLFSTLLYQQLLLLLHTPLYLPAFSFLPVLPGIRIYPLLCTSYTFYLT